MKVSEIYKKYQINKGLQEHMLRVAAVAKQVTDNYQGDLDAETVVKACLLHDMGNLLKFKFELAPDLCEPEGVAYWQRAQQEMKEKYGSAVYDATSAMVREIVSDTRILEIINEASFDEIQQVAEFGSTEAKLLEYADMRVGLFGVVSVSERFDYIKERYVPERFTSEEVDARFAAALQIEKEILRSGQLNADSISDDSIAARIEELIEWEI